MASEHLIIFVSFLCVFVFVLWCFPAEQRTGGTRLPFLLAMLDPIAELFSNDVGHWLERLFPVFSDRMTRRCREADMNWTAANLYGMQLTVMLVTFLLSSVAAFFLAVAEIHLVPVLCILMICGWLYPFFYVRHRAEKRMMEITRVMPFAIDIICSAMSAGSDFISAIRYYTSLEMNDTVSREFTIFLREIELGKSRSEALRNMAGRLYCEDFNRFASAIANSLESGSSIIDVMELQADEIRRLRFSRIEFQIAKVPSKMIIPIVLCIVPAVFIIVLVPLYLSIKDMGLFSALTNLKLK